MCATRRAQLANDDVALRETRSEIDAAKRKLAELNERIANKKKEKPRINLDRFITDPREIERDDPVGRRRRGGRPVRGPKDLGNAIREKALRRRKIDKEEAELKKQLQPQIDALNKEILRLEKIERMKLDLIPWLEKQVEKHCPRTD